MPINHAECIEACYKCATACDYCAASCLKEEQVDMMRECIRLDMQCANIC
ncbi:MAG: four-helix bundle copper-binding protein, partial [Leclercia adecarboxylata]|nr:four-helix bundle copper-binding protein [Leclercia adecarboxylata]